MRISEHCELAFLATMTVLKFGLVEGAEEDAPVKRPYSALLLKKSTTRVCGLWVATPGSCLSPPDFSCLRAPRRFRRRERGAERDRETHARERDGER